MENLSTSDIFSSQQWKCIMDACGRSFYDRLVHLTETEKILPKSVVLRLPDGGFRLREELERADECIVRIWTLLTRKSAGPRLGKLVDCVLGFSASASQDVRDYAAKHDVFPGHVVVEFFHVGSEQSFTIGASDGDGGSLRLYTRDFLFDAKLIKHCELISKLESTSSLTIGRGDSRVQTLHLLGMGPLKASHTQKLLTFLRGATSKRISSTGDAEFNLSHINFREILWGSSSPRESQPSALNCVAFAQWLFPEIVDCRALRAVPILVPGSCRALPGPRHIRFCREQSVCLQEQRVAKRSPQTEMLVQSHDLDQPEKRRRV